MVIVQHTYFFIILYVCLLIFLSFLASFHFQERAFIYVFHIIFSILTRVTQKY